jgi:carnitine O-acetyltransferase
METRAYDETGKIILSDIYNQDDPSGYFSTLAKLDYQIPGNAKPPFQRLIEARRQASGRQATRIVDLGCSYGVNGALLRHGLSMDDLYEAYASGEAADPEDRLRQDRARYASPVDADLEFVGVDTADRAVAYALDVGLLEAGVAGNLETHAPTGAEREAIADADLIISTGCVGYVTETSLERLIDASAETRPWMAHFVLRMFGFEAAEAMLGERGYVTEKVDGLYRQRRFASATEQESVLGNLDRIGVDPSGAEADGWLVAELYVARPRLDAVAQPLDAVVGRPVHARPS